MNARQLLPLSGVAAVVLIVVAFIVGGESPEVDDPLTEIVSYYSDNDSELQIASGLLSLGGFFFLLFTTAIAAMLRGIRSRHTPASILSLAGGIIFVVGVTVFAGLNFSAADAVGDIAPTDIQTLHVLSMDMFFTVAVGVGAFLLGTGVAALRSDALPTWLSWAAIVIGVVALTPAGFFGFLALGIWTVIVSVLLAMRAGPADRDVAGSP